MTLQRRAFAARAFNAALGMSAWLSNLPNRLTPAPFRLIQIGSAFWQSRALYTAARLDIATVLADQPRSCANLASTVGVNADALRRLMRMLVAMGVFQERSADVYGNNKLSSCLRTDSRMCVRPMILMHGCDVMCRPWYEQLEHGIRTGQPPFRLTHGQDLYAWMDTHADFGRLFGEAMDSVDALTGDSFATEFDWRSFSRVIDVGGARGAKSVAILRRHPHMSALVVDRPQAIQGANDYWSAHEAASLTSRLEFEAGDAFESLPPAASDKDIYLLSALLHGFSDDNCIKILRNVSQAATGKGALVIVMEMVLADRGADLPGASFDMQMFMGTEGRERTTAEWEQLFTRSGLVLKEAVRLASLGQMLVLMPASS
jgi:O-methyltransferase domain/Dimerisation domain